MTLKHYENERSDNDMGDSERSVSATFLQNYSWRDNRVVSVWTVNCFELS